MRFKSKKSQDTGLIVEMTPMIDIVFLLIIFFMVAAQFAQQARLEMKLPQERGESAKDSQNTGLVINIRNDGAIILDVDSPPITIDALDERVQMAVTSDSAPWESLLIRADQNASTTTLNEVLRLLNKHGLSATRIATEVP
ncbi:MAG: biopolymer transporter ExbD [Planctomycetes bacterium]|nr:biopolymer transporter ExbD [Planctomycetota bacterium]